MEVCKVSDISDITSLYKGCKKAMIDAYLQGYMGEAYTTNLTDSAVIRVGDFCFFAGQANEQLINCVIKKNRILIPSNAEWANLMEHKYRHINKRKRYALKKQKDIFDKEYLKSIVNNLHPPYTIQAIDKTIYKQIMNEGWANDLCSNFKDYTEFSKSGLGFVILYMEKIVAGASSYAVFNEGIEIEIDTKSDYRRQGLALVCGAKLILECLNRDIYPGWDAHNLGSLALAKKLGYQFAGEYEVYEVNNQS